MSRRLMGAVTRHHCYKFGMDFPSLSDLDYHKISKHSNVPD
jgi:hypothetical protein